LALGVLCAYFFERTKWKRVLLVISAIPIAILTNGIRIGATGVLSQKYGQKVAEGFFHGFSGWLVFMFAFAVLFVFHYLLKLVFKNGIPPTELSNPVKREHVSGIGGKAKSNKLPVVISSLSMLLVGVLSYTTAALPSIIVQGGLSHFPLSIAEWKGRVEDINPEMIDASGAQDAFSATYLDPTRNVVYLYMGYRGSPFLESENFFHSPNVCLPSSGWKTLSITTHEIAGVPHFGSIKVRKMVSERMGARQLVYFWFQTKNLTSYDVNINRFHLAQHAIFRDNTHDLFIRPITIIKPDETVAEAERRLDQFVRELTAVIVKFLDENQIEENV
jgi:EpsI family protein